MLILLVLLCGGGAYNYHRNMAAEQSQQGPRPFGGYDSAALEQLASAYQKEIESYERIYQEARLNRATARETALLGDAVRELERVQRSGRKVREATALVAEREARLREIRVEQKMREREQGGIALHLERLTGIPLT